MSLYLATAEVVETLPQNFDIIYAVPKCRKSFLFLFFHRRVVVPQKLISKQKVAYTLPTGLSTPDVK